MKKIKKLLSILGPGFITGASDDDPSGIATYSQTGAQFGYSQAWTAPFSFPFMSAIQEMCGRVGMMSGKGIAVLLRDHFPKPILYSAVFLLLFANTVNIGANLGAMASSVQLLVNFPFELILLLFTVLTLLLEVFVPYPAYSRILKYLAFSLLAYIATAFFVKQQWSQVIWSSLIPSVSLNREYLMNIVAILGTTISPYLFFWQADEEIEEEISKGKIRSMGRGIPKIFPRDIKKMRTDTFIGMFFSNLVMFFIIIVAAAALHANGITNIETADQAAAALKPFAGDFAFVLFALGIVGTGLLAVPILAGSAAYAVSETFNWKVGLGQKFSRAHGFYGVITIATLIGLFVNFIGVEPFKMLYYTAIVNGLAAPPLIIVILIVANNKKIMNGKTNSKLSNILGITITAIMIFAAVALVFDLLF